MLLLDYKLFFLTVLIVPQKLKAHHSAPIVLGEQRMLTLACVAYI